MKIFGIEITLGGEAETNEKLDRYNALSANAATETYEEWLTSPTSEERIELLIELQHAGIIEYVEDKPEPTAWQKFWGG